ncbi:MAG: DUF3300 domain-containing protein [Rhodospirillales bacterium]|nr:DUF3300 domain-containing protein [Rhodospirillales bacterium]
MNADLDWTQALGNAAIDQQKDVMDMIQQIRSETYAGGYLKSDEKQTVVQEKETIIIQSADPQYIYVPNYDPQVVYVDHGPYYSYPPPVYYATPYPYYWSPAATFFAGAFVGAAFGYGFNGFVIFFLIFAAVLTHVRRLWLAKKAHGTRESPHATCRAWWWVAGSSLLCSY